MRLPVKLFLSLSLVAIISVAAVLPAKKNFRTYVSNYENVLGTSLELKLQSASQEDADRAERAALAEIDRLNSILSGYDKSSEFSRWMQTRNEAVKVSGDLYEVLDLFGKWRERTSGALDPSAQVISNAWKDAAAKQQLPSDADLRIAVEKVKRTHYRLDPEAHTATHLDDSPLILNSFAKSYIINKAAEASSAIPGITAVVINIGGDIVVKGARAERIDISNPKADAENDAPMAVVQISNRAIATSGNYRRGVEINGQWYSHIVDPRNGKPAGGIISSTVVAENATDAGALATAFNVLSPEESKMLASTVKGAEYLIITREGKRYESSGWRTLETSLPSLKPSATVAVERSKDKLWDTKFELVINLELASIEGTRVRRPFVAVWITDAKKKPVRNINVWYSKPRWIRDLVTWFKDYGHVVTPEENPLASTTSATRSPGKYSLKWDGKDDAGKLVKEGDYIVNIEVAREHGTYQLITKQLKFVGKATQTSLPANVEIASASLDYRKKQSN